MNYSFLDKLLYKFFLGNNIFQEVLFDVDKLFFYKKKKEINSLIITGLPRSGTTILLNELYKTKKFASLTFQDLPFLLSPNIYNFLRKIIKTLLLINLWEKFVLKNKKNLNERIHRDGIFVSDEMPEAFDEVFWRVFNNKKYITKNYLLTHNIGENEMIEYQKYVNIITFRENKNLYIAKNNNNILRLNSFKKLKNTFIIVTFRDPLFHSHSLIKTHKIIIDSQKKNNFIKNYMDYLVHHEFGQNLKTMKFDNNFETEYLNTDINFWLSYWIYIYQNILKNYNQSSNVQFLAYEKFNIKIIPIMKKFNLNTLCSEKYDFQNKNNPEVLKNYNFDEKLITEAKKIYNYLDKL